MWRALRHRNYRLFFTGQTVSLIGTWLTRVATGWLVYRLTDDAFLLGMAAFAGQIPTFVVAPLAGVLIERWDRHRVLVVTQVFSLIQSALLAAFALTGTITVTHIILLNIMQGLINAFDTPARQAFVVEMIEDRADLPNAIALNSSMVNMARLVGPTVAGLLIAAFGEGWCFAIDAASYLAVIGSLLAMRVKPRPAPARSRRVLADLADGLRYIWHFPLVRAVLLLLASSSVLGGAYSTLLPVIAATTLRGGPHTLGILMGAAGCGALAGALYLASRTSVVGLTAVIQRCALGLGAGMLAMELASRVEIAVPLLFLIGMSMMVQMAATNTLIQSIVDDKMCGRAISLYAVAFFGGAPIGSLLEGMLANQIGAIHTFAVAGVLCLTASAVFASALPALRRVSRPHYIKLGLIPDPAAPRDAAGPGTPRATHRAEAD